MPGEVSLKDHSIWSRFVDWLQALDLLEPLVAPSTWDPWALVTMLNYHYNTYREPVGSREIRLACGDDKTIAFISGNFNVVHPGHLRLLKFAAEHADVLVVGVNS